MDDLLLNMFPHFSHVVERIATPSWRINQEVYQMYNLLLIYDGQAEFFWSGRSRIGTRGDLVCFRPGDLRRAHTFPDHLLKCFAVDFVYTCPVWQEGEWRLTQADLPFEPLRRIHDTYLFSRLLDLFAELTRTWLSGAPSKTVRCRAVFLEIMTLLLMEKAQGELNYAKIRKIETVTRYLTEHYAESISLERLSGAAQISPSYLGSIFKEVTGKTPLAYLTGIRINKAKELLRDGCTVSETALRVGFHDIFYFSKCFKKHEGVAPSQYQNN